MVYCDKVKPISEAEFRKLSWKKIGCAHEEGTPCTCQCHQYVLSNKVVRGDTTMRLYDVLRAPKKENGVYIPGNFKPMSMKDAQRILLKYVKRDNSTSIRIVKKGGGYRDIVGRSSP